MTVDNPSACLFLVMRQQLIRLDQQSTAIRLNCVRNDRIVAGNRAIKLLFLVAPHRSCFAEITLNGADAHQQYTTEHDNNCLRSIMLS